MSDPTDGTETGIDRRTVLKSAAAASVAGFVGVPALSGSAAASSHLRHQFYGVHPYDGLDGGERYLLGFDPDPDGSGNIDANAVPMTGDVPNGYVVTAAFDPDGDLYAIDISQNQLMTIGMDGAVSTVGDPNPDLTSVPGSAITPSDDGSGHLYCVNKDANKLIEADLSDGATVGSNDLRTDDSWDGGAGQKLSDVYGGTGYHIGLTVDFTDPDSDLIYGVIGTGRANAYQGSGDEIVTIDRTDGTVHLVAADVITELTLVGVEYESCGDGLFAVREGQDLWRVEPEADTDSQMIGTITVDDFTPEIASLASPYPDTALCSCEVDLLAGQETKVGTVTADLSSETPTVTYETTDNWYLAETHLEVVGDPDDFPTAGNNNPKVGHFTYSRTYGPGIQTDTYNPDLRELEGPYYVAAHAVVYHVDCGTAGDPSFYATEIDADLGTTKADEPIRDKYDDADAVLGEPAEEHDLDGDAFLSLGFGGSATVGFESPVYNTDGDRDIFVYETTGSSSSSWTNYPEETATIYVKGVGSDEWVEAGDVSNKDTVKGWDGLGAVGIPSDIVAVDEVKIVDTTDASIHDDAANGYDLNAVGADCIQDQEETAWGDGCEFTDKGSWAMYTEYDSENDICGCGDDGNGNQA